MEDSKQEKSNKYSLVRRMEKWVKPYSSTFILCLLLLLFHTSVQIFGQIIIQIAIDDYIMPGNFSGLITIMAFYILIVILGFVANYLEIIKLETVGQIIIANIKNQAFRHIINLNMSYFDKSSTGKLVSRVENDSNAMRSLFTSVITNMLGSIIILFGVLGLMAFRYSSKVALSVIIIFPFMIIGGLLFNKVISPILIKIRKFVAEVSGFVTESIHGISIIQIFGQENRILKELKDKSTEKFREEAKSQITFNVFFNILFFMETLATLVIITIGGRMVLNGEMKVGALVLFINSIRLIMFPIIQISGQFNEFQKGISGASRIFDLLDTKNTIPEPEHKKDIPGIDKGIDIEFRNVWFRYDDDSDWVLKDISFKCPRGEHWAIVGPTGSGKTTIISLLLKFYLPVKGEILLNGVNIRDISQYDLRKGLGLVLQDNILFPGTVSENLSLNNPDYSEIRVKDLMKKLGIHQIIEKLPEGYNTLINENASNLSSGEKQLISFGRALLKDPSILIFDEATSNIDPEIENKIKTAMNNLIQGRTAMIIAHRLSTIQNADKIMVLHNGTMIELGNHHELLSFGGFYSRLNQLQEAG